jgi:hypothetical protein
MNFDQWLKDNRNDLDSFIGKQFWICDFRLNSSNDFRPIRKVIPKLVQIFCNADLPKGKNIYYSPIHFREVKNGKILSTVIAPYDNTGYRSYSGVAVNIFETEFACKEFFKIQCDKVIRDYQDELTRRAAETQHRIDEIKQILDE